MFHRSGARMHPSYFFHPREDEPGPPDAQSGPRTRHEYQDALVRVSLGDPAVSRTSSLSRTGTVAESTETAAWGEGRRSQAREPIAPQAPSVPPSTNRSVILRLALFAGRRACPERSRRDLCNLPPLRRSRQIAQVLRFAQDDKPFLGELHDYRSKGIDRPLKEENTKPSAP